MKKISTNQSRTPDDKWPTPLLDKVCAGFDKVAVEWPSGLPKPNHFPATRKDFLAVIIKAKTPADSMARFRRFLGASAGRNSHWFADKPITVDEREAWAISQIQAINDGDKKVGYFTVDIWLAMGSAYIYWWQDQKSAKARESVNKSARVRESKTKRKSAS
jgi:hypothetical protein